MKLVVGLVLCLALPAAAQVDRGSALAHYDLAGPPAWRAALPNPLSEVSGLAATPSGQLLAHGDERAVIWRFDPVRRRTSARFGLGARGHLLRGDFEDIARVGERLFLVTEGGEIFEGRTAPDGTVGPGRRRTFGLGRGCAAEGLAWDAPSRSLLMLCKTARTERWKDHLIVLAISIDSWRFENRPRLLVPSAAIQGVTGHRHFHGTALVRHPRTGSYLVLAGPEHAFVELSPSGAVLGGGRLDHDLYRQPEGMAVGPDLTLFISDEARGHTAHITAYAFRP
jgi:hypothetical protein